jgi:hypothetical protein
VSKKVTDHILAKLHPEVFHLIVVNTHDLRSLNSLLRTCHAFYSALNYALYDKGCASHESEFLVWAVHKGKIATVQNFLELFPPTAVTDPRGFYTLLIFVSIIRGRGAVFETMLRVADPDSDDLACFCAWCEYVNLSFPFLAVNSPDPYEEQYAGFRRVLQAVSSDALV